MIASDSELEEDEEEILVYVEFDNFATNDVFSSENLKLDMLGLDSDHPIMQINGKFFEGTYENAAGTYLFFDKDNNPEFDDPVFDKIPSLKYFNKTRKLLRMQRAFLVPRHEVVGDSQNNKCIPNEETLKEAGVPPKYQEEALKFWEKSRDFRIQALHKYLEKQEFRKEMRNLGFEPDSASDEENPFAMYKFQGNESINVNENKKNHIDSNQAENMENTTQDDEAVNKSSTGSQRQLTVIDPGPSTSRSSRPWIGDENEDDNSDGKDDDADWIPFSKKVKSIGRVRSRVAKPKDNKKFSKKKKSVIQNDLKENDVDQISEVSYISNGTQKSLSVSNKTDKSSEISNSDNNKQKKTKSQIVKNDEIEFGEVAMEENNRLLTAELNLVDEKEKRKQERREAKMREIKERLEAIKKERSSQAAS